MTIDEFLEAHPEYADDQPKYHLEVFTNTLSDPSDIAKQVTWQMRVYQHGAEPMSLAEGFFRYVYAPLCGLFMLGFIVAVIVGLCGGFN